MSSYFVKGTTHGIIFLWVLSLCSFVLSTSLTGLENSTVNAESELQSARQRLSTFDQTLSLQDRKQVSETDFRDRDHLTPYLRSLASKRRGLQETVLYWERTVHLKKDILSLTGDDKSHENDNQRERWQEAGLIAQTAIQAFEELRSKYQMIRPAVLHNILVNSKLKKEGLCWHWTRDLMKRLNGPHLKEYDLLWITAREGKLREHNSLVVVPHGRGYEEGILLDGWRKSGVPFWIKVSQDHYPWKMGSYAGDLEEVGLSE